MSNNDGVGPGGKGDKQRPTDKKKFDENFDRIFGKKEKTEDVDGNTFRWRNYKEIKEYLKETKKK